MGFSFVLKIFVVMKLGIVQLLGEIGILAF
jgi:hypothetical protein